MVRPDKSVGEKPVDEEAEADSLLQIRTSEADRLERGAKRETATQDVLDPSSKESLSFLKLEKNKIYTSRDFSNKGLTHKQKAAIAVLLVLMALLLKALFVDPFKTDKTKWEKKKSLVDEADTQAVALNPNATVAKSLFELKKDAEDFVRAEEGINV